MVDATANLPCPPYRLLAEYSARSLADSDARGIEEHLAGCQACRETIQELEAEGELTTRLRSAMGLQNDVPVRQRLQTETAGQYEVLETLGSGAGGVVFKCRDVKLNRLVAIKCFWPSAEDGQDLLTAAFHEARQLATISHPNIAAIYSISERPDAPFIVMEFVDGVPITEALGDRPIAQQLEAFERVLRAVSELHRNGLVHRDLKPANALADHQGNVKLVDFGIAQRADPASAGKPQGTPAYLAPEQSLGHAVHPAADVFSLGVILFELLTGQRPFSGQTPGRVIAAIREQNPPLPRSLREEIPGALQAICLTALEKDPALRYPSAHEFQLDLERFKNGEAVWANPSLLSSVLDHGIERHVTDIRRWEKDRMISARECDYFLDKYGGLRQREEFWVLDSRRISFSQVMLHLGIWSCAVSAFLMLVFPWPHIGVTRFVLPAVTLMTLLIAGLLLWKQRTRRVAIVLLMGAAITCPIAVATALAYFKLLQTGHMSDDLLPGIITNRQLFAATLCALFLSIGLWWRTRTAAFALITSLCAVAITTAAFGMHGLRQQLSDGHLDIVAGWYLAPAALLFLIAMTWDLQWKATAFAAPFYHVSLILLLLGMTLIARFGPTLQWLGFVHDLQNPQLDRHIDYAFMINGAIYLFAGLLLDRSTGSSWLRWIATLLFWLAPSHLLVPIFRLESNWPIAGTTWTIAEIILPIAALLFIFSSVHKQMKSFFFSGLFYTALSVQRLTARHFEDKLAWPIALAAAGVFMAVIAWRYPALLDKRRGVSGTHGKGRGR